MRRTNTTGQRVGLFSLGLLLCGLMGLTGGLLGARLAQRYQPQQIRQESPEAPEEEPEVSEPEIVPRWHNQVMELPLEDAGEQDGLPSAPVISIPDTINAETEYILREKDLLNGSEVETSEEIPDMYIGMNREQFVAAMENYAAAPPCPRRRGVL